MATAAASAWTVWAREFWMPRLLSRLVMAVLRRLIAVIAPMVIAMSRRLGMAFVVPMGMAVLRRLMVVATPKAIAVLRRMVMAVVAPMGIAVSRMLMVVAVPMVIAALRRLVAAMAMRFCDR